MRATTDAPAYADLLCAFANTLDVDVDADPPEALLDSAALARWLGDRGLLEGESHADGDDLGLAITLRSGLREAMALHHERDQSMHVPALDAAAEALPLSVAFDASLPRLTPAVSGVRGGLARLLIAISDAAADGNWTRLKLCVADDCLLAFYDTSKNRSRLWCSMGMCGNRQKTRKYRARRREALG